MISLNLEKDKYFKNPINQGFNLNNRSDFLLHSAEKISQKNIQRIASLAIPFLNLYQPASMGLSLLLGSLEIWTLGKEVRQDLKEGNWLIAGKRSFEISIITTTVALSILNPLAAVLLSSSRQISQAALLFGKHLKDGNFIEACRQLALIGHQLIYITASIYGAPELLFLSLFSQAMVEVYRASKEWKNEGRLLETIAHLLMACLRLYSASGHAKVVHRNYFGQQVKQEDIKLIFEDIQKQKNEHPEKPVDLEKILIDRYYSSKIRNISLKQDGLDLSKILFRNMDFFNCDFSGVDLSDSVFQRVTADHCNFEQAWAINTYFERFQAFHCRFKNAYFINAFWSNCHLDVCDFEGAGLQGSYFNQTHFEKSDLDYVNFYRSVFKQTTFSDNSINDATFAETFLHQTHLQNSRINRSSFNSANLKETAFENCQMRESSFFDAQVETSRIKDSDLTDILLLDNKDSFQISGGIHHVTKPVVGVLWNFESPLPFVKIIYEGLKECGAVVLKFDYRLRGSNQEQLEVEIQEKIATIQENGLSKGSFSIGDTLLKGEAGQELEKIKLKTEKVASYLQGLLLPGGSDIEPEFYGQTDQHNEMKDYERTVFEMGMISQALSKNLPVLGICRGSQIFNVFKGGTLTQHVDDHSGVVHSLKIKESVSPEVKDLAKNILQGDQINGLSMHHQASDKIGKGLEVVLEHENVPEALMSKDGKIVLTQFHPEGYLMDLKEIKEDNEMNEKTPPLSQGKNFFTNLVQQAKNHFG